MKKLVLLLAIIPGLSLGYEFAGYSVPRATQRTTENELFRDFSVDQTNRTEQTLLQEQPMMDLKINTETELISDQPGQKVLLDLRRSDPRYITPANINLPLLPSSSSLRNPNLVK